MHITFLRFTVSYVWKCMETTLKITLNSLWCNSWFMWSQVPFDVLLQLLCLTYLTVNISVAWLHMSLKTLLISKIFHTTWFRTEGFHRVQLNCTVKAFIRQVIHHLPIKSACFFLSFQTEMELRYYLTHLTHFETHQIRCFDIILKTEKEKQLAMSILVLSQLWREFEHLSTSYFLADMLLLTPRLRGRRIFIMNFFHMPFHIALKCEFSIAVLNRTLKKFSLVLKKVAIQVVFPPIASMTIIN